MAFRELTPDEEIIPLDGFQDLPPNEAVLPLDTPAERAGAPTFINRGIATILGAPVDLVNAGLGAVGIPVSGQPVGGRDSLEAFMQRVFGDPTGSRIVPMPGQQAETPGDYVARGVGETVGALIPGFAVASRAAASASPIVRGVGQSLIARPVATAGIDTAMGAGAGAGRYIGERAPAFEDNPELGGIVGELAGGLSVGAAAAAPRAAMSLPVTGTVARAGAAAGRHIAGAVMPNTRAGSLDRASNRVRGLVADPEAMRDVVEAPSIGNLTPAQRTGDDRLLALERAVAESDPRIADALKERARESTRILEEEMRGLGGDPSAARAFIQNRVQRLNDALGARLSAAQQRAQDRIAALEPTTARDQPAIIVREEFDKAYRDGLRQESRLWSEIPDDVEVSTEPVFEAYQRIVKATPRTQMEDIPDYARRFLDRDMSNSVLGPSESPKELQGLRSKLLELSRTSRAAGQRNTARIADDLADAVLEAMNSADNVTEPYQIARDFSRTLNQTFRQGEVASLVRTDRDGALRVPPERTLEATVGRDPTRAALADRGLMQAIGDFGGDTEAAQRAVTDYLRRQFSDNFTRVGGGLNEQAAFRWMRTNDALLSRYPELRQQFADAIEAQRAVTRAADRAGRVGTALQQPKNSAAARYLGGDVHAEVEQIFKAPDPAVFADQIKRQVSKDPSGEAMAGLKGSLVDYMIGQARQSTPDGVVLNGSAIRAIMDDPRQAGAVRAILSNQERRRLDAIVGELTNLERTRGRLPGVGPVMDDAPNTIMATIARIAGARAGAAAGGGGMAGSLQSAQIMSGRVKRFMERLTNDRATVLISEAVTDPDLFATLMSPMRGAGDDKRIARQFNAWMVGPGLRLLEESETEGEGE
jgi:hypothetical protein